MPGGDLVSETWDVKGVTKVKRPLLIMAVIALIAGSLSADVFRFAYAKGEKYRILSQVHESVYVNGQFSHDADILNKIAVAVTDTKGDAGYHVVDFQTSERTQGSRTTYEWSEEYASEFWRDGRGAYTIGPSYFMPVMRDVPLFPEGDVRLGGTWSARGMESHDFRANFGIQDPFQFPVTVNYAYVDTVTRNGIACALLTIEYELFHPVSLPRGTARMIPTRVAGSSRQKYWWGLADRKPIYYEESFDFIFTFSTGDEVEFKGTATGELVIAAPLDRARVVDDIRKQLDAEALPDVSVKQTEEGVTITVENVNFPPNSDQLLPAEQAKLRRIADILKKYPDRDISVAGFTARAAGYTETDYQTLSEQRANAAANFLLSTGAVTAERMTARGMGARSPIGDNSTEAGMRKNRRVEITILEN
jgi:outer membrane protein OmpA-like peptidoglycan-associated protein